MIVIYLAKLADPLPPGKSTSQNDEERKKQNRF